MARDFRQRGYLTYRVPAHDDRNNMRLLIGAFESEREAAKQIERLSEDGFTFQIVRR
jgi:hypothetical protein